MLTAIHRFGLTWDYWASNYHKEDGLPEAVRRAVLKDSTDAASTLRLLARRAEALAEAIDGGRR